MMLTNLWDTCLQFQYKNGTLLVDGKIYVYFAGRTELATTYTDIEGSSVNPNPIIIDNHGQANCFVDDAFDYTIIVKDAYGNEQFSRTIHPAGGEGGTAPVTRIVSDDDSIAINTSTVGSVTTWNLEVRDAVTKSYVDTTVDDAKKELEQEFAEAISDEENAREAADNNLQDAIDDISDALDDKKDKQLAVKYAGNNKRTITDLRQDENGKITFVTFSDIDFPEEVPNIEIESNTLSVKSTIDEATHTKTFTIDVKNGDGHWINARSAGTNIGIDENVKITGYTKKDGNIDIVPEYNLLPLKNEVPYLVIEEVTLKTAGQPVDKCSEVQVHLFNEGISGEHAGDIVANVTLDNSNAYTQTVTVGGILYGGETGRTEDTYNGGIYASVMNKFTGSVIEGIITATVNSISVYELSSIMTQGGSTYTGGDAIDISNDTISVKYGNGLELDTNNKLKVKLGKGLKFDTEAGIEGEISIDDIGQEVIEEVQELSSELDKKITTTFNYAQIKDMQDFAPYGVSGTTRLIGQLFAVPIASEIRKDDTLICVRALQNYSGKVSFGIFEFDFDGNEGSGSTTWLADTGVVSVQAGENAFPIRHIVATSAIREKIKLEPGKLYYATILIDGNAPATGLMLAADEPYAANYNATPKYTMVASNMDTYVDWTNGSQEATWFQGYNEFHDVPRLFMMIRNGESAPVPIVDPFKNYDAFTLAHSFRVSDIFSLSVNPDQYPIIYQKVRPQLDCTVTKIGWCDYHSGATYEYDSDIPLILDGDYNALTMFDANTVSSEGTKIDGTHYYHEYTLATPLNMTADTNYYIPCNAKISNGNDEWIITYSSPADTSKDLVLFTSKWNINQWAIAGGYAEYKNSTPSTFCRIFTDDGKSYTF